MKHFEKTYSYIRWTAIAIIGYIFLITFVPIPKDNMRFVDIALAYLMGFLGNGNSYLTGSNPESKKKEEASGTTTTEINGTIKTDKTIP